MSRIRSRVIDPLVAGTPPPATASGRAGRYWHALIPVIVLATVVACTSQPSDPVTSAPTRSPTRTPVAAATSVSSPDGRTFYISPTGSDRADGSMDNPRLTILAGSELLKPGDTLLVRGGTYHDPGRFDWASTASGTASEPITVKAYPGETPVFDGNATAQATSHDSNPRSRSSFRTWPMSRSRT